MNRNLLIGVALGAIIAAVPLVYLGKDRNAFEIDSSQSTVISVPGADAVADAPLDDFLQRDEAATPTSGLVTTDIPLVSAPDTDAGENRIRELVREEIKANPGIVIDAIRADASGVLNALNTYMAEQQANEEKNRDAQTLAAEPRLTRSEGYPVVGNPEGKVEMFYYFDANCHYCKQLEPDLARFVEDNPDVKLVHREMPILADSSRYAALMSGLLFARHPESYASFHSKLMSYKPGMTNDDVDAALTGILGDDKALPIIVETRDPTSSEEAQAVSMRVSESLSAATEAGVTGTPFIIVKDSGLILRGAAKDSYVQFQSMAARARAKNAEKAAQ